MNIDDQLSQSCFANRSGNALTSLSTLQEWRLELGWRYNADGTRSSLTVLPGSLSSNQTYQIRAELISRQDPSRLFTGHVTVQVQLLDSIEVSVG